MFNNSAENIVIIFLPNTRGNFLKNCLTFSTNTADSSLKNTSLESRLKEYKKRVEETPSLSKEPPYGPGHTDSLSGDSRERLNLADYSERYIHASHHNSMSFLMDLPNTKFVVITVDNETAFRFMVKYKNDKQIIDEMKYHTNNNYWYEHLNTDWYELPYKDILDKGKFIQHCVSITNDDTYIDMISDYYDLYYRIAVEENPR